MEALDCSPKVNHRRESSNVLVDLDGMTPQHRETSLVASETVTSLMTTALPFDDSITIERDEHDVIEELNGGVITPSDCVSGNISSVIHAEDTDPFCSSDPPEFLIYAAQVANTQHLLTLPLIQPPCLRCVTSLRTCCSFSEEICRLPTELESLQVSRSSHFLAHAFHKVLSSPTKTGVCAFRSRAV